MKLDVEVLNLTVVLLNLSETNIYFLLLHPVFKYLLRFCGVCWVAVVWVCSGEPSVTIQLSGESVGPVTWSCWMLQNEFL